MQTISEIINSAYAVYMRGASLGETEGAAVSLDSLLSDGRMASVISSENRENAQFLRIKLGLKGAALRYFTGGYGREDFSSLKRYADEHVAICADKGFKKTGALCGHVSDCAERCEKVVSVSQELFSRVFDGEGRCVSSQAEDCAQVAEELRAQAEVARSLGVGNPFTDGASFPDIDRAVAGYISELAATCEKAAGELVAARAAESMRTGCKDITEELGKKKFSYYPSVADADRLANAIVLFTPFGEEAELFAYACADGAKIYRLQALALEGGGAECFKAVFDRLASLNADCVAYGMPHYRAKDKSEFYRAAMNFARGGRRIYIVSDDGTRKVYEEAAAAATGALSALDISFLYLSMPDFSQTVEELRRLNMIGDDGEEYVKKNMPFMGFYGLNEAVKAFAAGADWRAVAAARSADNFAAAEKFMLRLPRQALFIDGGWGNYHEDIIVNKGRGFDYDDIKSVNPDNVKKIVQSNFNLFEKCGMISVYCLLGGADAADWKSFSAEVKSERLTESCKLVMRALGVDIVPIVEVVEKMTSQGAGGMCYDGGKRIVYKAGSVKDFEWISKAVCHECFHAFQRKAVNDGWQEWYATELHVTRGRIDEWSYNFGKYRQIDKDYDGYMIQTVESDARAFENDCLGKYGSAVDILKLIDLD